MAPGSVEYLLHGCDSRPATDVAQDLDLPGSEHTAGRPPGVRSGVGAESSSRSGAAGYLQAGVAAGEPDGVWLGRGMAGLGLSMRSGDRADPDDVRALFGQMRYPESQVPGSTDKTPVYLGSKPRKFRTGEELAAAAVDKARAAGPVTAEQEQAIEALAKKEARRPTAYYDVTFSPVKSVSIMYAALLAAGDYDGANAIRDAHDEAIRIAIASVEDDLAYVRTGRHEGRGPSGHTVGRWERATGLMVAVYAHHTNRDGEPQLHAHAAVSARAATRDGRIYAIDGFGFHAIKDALATAYTRAYQQLTSERLGFVYQRRADGAAREIVGVSAELLAEGSSRTLAAVRPLVAELVEAYIERHGREPGPKARRALVEQAVKDTRKPKTGIAGPGAVAAWVDGEPVRRERLAAALDAAEQAAVDAVLDGDAPPRPDADGAGAGAGPGAGAVRGDGRQAALAVLAGMQPAHTAAAEPAAEPDAAAARTGATPATGPDGMVVLVAEAIERGIADVQARYATWTVGNLVRAIDEHLGDHAGALGVPAAQRPAFLSTIAGHVLAVPQRFGIVQVTAGDPVPVPDVLRRTGPGEDGRPKFRAHIDERYATAAHLTAERRLLAALHTTGSVRAGAEQMAAVHEQLAALGLSPDQAAAVAGVLSSGRATEVIVGPAGTGKSHTMGVLGAQWRVVTGGRVLGVASARIAARNLAGLGMDARTIHALLRDLRPDPDTGLVRDQLGPRDLVVVDEAAMTPTADLVAIADLAGQAGAKVVLVGDHHQLQPVGAGGMFAHLAAQDEAFELATVHRFSQAWEARASLLLRDGDPAAAAEYADRGRLVCGTLDEVTAMAVRGHLADMLDGRSALLIVSSNQLAADLSHQVHDELVARGRVGADPLIHLPDHTPISVGDLIQARLNDSRLHVDPGPDGSRTPVTNREIYTVVGRLQDGTLLARDERGALAHLPDHYVREHVTLAYAITAHAAQGVTVDVGRGVLSLDATREQAYVPASRGRDRNLLYLQTEHRPDSHEPQRVQETPVQRFTDILLRSGVDEAALTALETARADEASMATLGALYAGVSKDFAHAHNAAMLAEILGPALAARLDDDGAFGALLGAVYAAELDGHDPRALLTEAAAMGDFGSARSLAQVLHWRVGARVAAREPELRAAGTTTGTTADADAATAGDTVAVDRGRDWDATARELPDGHPVRRYLLAVGERIEQRRGELGAQAAAEQPDWAQQRLPAVPDPHTDPDARAAWERRAGIAAAYREYRGIPDTQISLGEPPPPAQQFARAMWLDAVDALDDDPVTARVSQASDAELRQTREAWERAVRDADEHGPRSVADQMSGLYRIAAEIRDDAVLTQADADARPRTDPQHAALNATAERYRRTAQDYLTQARALERDHAARQQWWNQVAPLRDADHAAAVELHRRSRALPDPQQPTTTTDTAAPERRPTRQPGQPRSAGASGVPVHRSAGHAARGRGARSTTSAPSTGPDRDQARRTARAEADQRAVEAARRGERTAATAPQLGLHLAQTSGQDPRTRNTQGGTADPQAVDGPDYTAENGYDWD